MRSAQPRVDAGLGHVGRLDAQVRRRRVVLERRVGHLLAENPAGREQCAVCQQPINRGGALIAEATQRLIRDDTLGLEAQVLEHLLRCVLDTSLALDPGATPGVEHPAVGSRRAAPPVAIEGQHVTPCSAAWRAAATPAPPKPTTTRSAESSHWRAPPRGRGAPRQAAHEDDSDPWPS